MRTSDFDRSFNRTRRFIMVMFVLVFLIVITVFGTVGTVAFKAATDPEGTGEHIGKFINGVTSQIEALE